MQIGSGIIMVVFLYGYGLVFFISCLMGYQITFLETVFICSIAYLISRSLLRNKKNCGITIISFIAIVIIGNAVLYFIGYFEWMRDLTINFMKPYYLSLSENGAEIDLLRQNVMILFIATFAYQIINGVKDKKHTLEVFLSLAFVMCIGGYLTESLTSLRDFYGFIIFSAANLLFYFYHYFVKHKASLGSHKPSFKSFAGMCAVFIIGVIGLSYLFYLKYPRPFEIPEKVGTTPVGSSQEELNKIKEYYDYEINQGGKISDEFIFEGVELFQVKTEHTRYLKGLVYENFEESGWLQAEDNLSLLVEDALALSEVPSEIEDITVNFTNLQSNVIFIGGQEIFELQVGNALKVKKDSHRGTFSIADYIGTIIKTGVNYNYKSVIRDMRAQQMVGLLSLTPRQNFDLSQTAYAMPEGYEDIKELATEVTKDAKSQYEQVEAILKYLRNNYTYSIKPDISKRGDEEPIRYFLFGNKEGFCQHFATSAVLMMRSLEIPARYVTGFYVDTEISYEDVMENYANAAMIGSGYKLITDADAHAWLEVFFPQTGWTMFEATPGIYSEEAIEPNEQLTMGETHDEVVQEKNNSEMLTIMLFVLGGLVLGLMIWSMVNGFIKKHTYRRLNASEQLKVYYTLIISYLSVIQLDKYAYETPREHSQRVDQKGFIHSDYQFKDLISSYENVHYGLYDITIEEVMPFKCYMKDVKKDAIKYSGILRCLKTVIKEFVMT